MYFVETTNEVTVIRSILTTCTSSTAAAAVDTAFARGSVLLITHWYTSMSTYKGTISRNVNIPGVCTAAAAAAVVTACTRGSVLPITYQVLVYLPVGVRARALPFVSRKNVSVLA